VSGVRHGYATAATDTGHTGACDTKDGVTDGVLEDPTRCTFDPGPGSIDLTAAQVVVDRPLCANPQVATYSGSGSTDDAANFTCR
jgi:hypothetical protein